MRGATPSTATTPETAGSARLTNFVTDLLPGVNPTYAPWTAPDAVPEAVRATLEQTVRAQLLDAGQGLAAAGLTRLQDGNTAIVVSYTNAGKVDEFGVEVGLGVAVTPGFRLDGTYTFFDFDVDSTSLLPGDELSPIRPSTRELVSASYRGAQGLDLRISGRFVDSYDWAAGVFVGPIPSSQTIDVGAGYRINDFVRVQALATNVLDQQRYHIYGGSVIGRRVLGGITVTF